MTTRWVLVVGLAFSAGLCLTGCDGHGFDLGIKISTGDNTPSPGDGGGTPGDGNTGGGTTPSPKPFAGTWLASYGDDQPGDGSKQYAVRLLVSQDANTGALSGTGTMFRVFRSGTASQDVVDLTLSGTAQGSSAQLVFHSKPSTVFDFNPVWTLRATGNRMTGVYEETDTNAALVVSGHAVWNLITSGALNDAWISGYTDAYAATGLKTNDTSAAVSLAAGADNKFTGDGLQAIIKEGATPDELNFLIAGEIPGGSQINFTFDGSDLTGKAMDWWGFYSANYFVGAYGQFTAENNLNRFGHATWYSASGVTADRVTRTWVTSFGDSAASAGAELSDYVMQVTLSLQTGAEVTGTALVLNERDTTPQFKSYALQNGTISGTRVRFELAGAGTTFAWDLNLSDTAMAGCYQQFNTSGTFLSRGIAEWRPGGTSSLVGTWTAAYVDTLRVSEAVATQLSRVTIATQTSSGALSGSGTLHFPGESADRTFSVSGTRSGSQIDWTFPGGTGLAGDFVWHMRQAGDILFGTYTNFTTTDVTEARGHAIWFRSTLSGS
ncbi:MAG: hypothetical protein HZB26_23615 [Candidatus Hydrogenedentes bacterium]|nr:hypothetical protein [Candidatus Hydrogenedentota bacterium]